MASIWTSFLIGLLATASPCVLPLYPGYLAYLSGGQTDRLGKGRFFLGFFVLTGVLGAMLILGGLISLASVSIGKALALVIPIADLIILVLGVLLVMDVNLFKRIPQVRAPLFAHPFANAFLYGLLYGPLTMPCSGALVVGMFSLSLTFSDALNTLLAFFWFGLGMGTPLLLLSFLAGSAQHWITRTIARYSRWFNLAAGLLLIGISLYDVYQNWDNFRFILRTLAS